jgi:hypothetical protein
MTSTELTSTQAPQEAAADLGAPWSRSPHAEATGYPADLTALVHPGAAGRDLSTQPRADRRGPAALWLRRALADCARAWALAAGVPPDLYP